MKGRKGWGGEAYGGRNRAGGRSIRCARGQLEGSPESIGGDPADPSARVGPIAMGAHAHAAVFHVLRRADGVAGTEVGALAAAYWPSRPALLTASFWASATSDDLLASSASSHHQGFLVLFVLVVLDRGIVVGIRAVKGCIDCSRLDCRPVMAAVLSCWTGPDPRAPRGEEPNEAVKQPCSLLPARCRGVGTGQDRTGHWTLHLDITWAV